MKTKTKMTVTIEKIVSGKVLFWEESLRLRGKLTSSQIDKLVWEAVFGDEGSKAQARWIIWELAQKQGVRPASIHDFYIARGRGKLARNFSVPAINIRGMAYDMGRSIFAAAKKLKVGALVLELARSEMGYTDQSPAEYVSVILGAALREDFKGPVFIQGDHFQTKMETPGKAKAGEIRALKDLIEESIKAGFYNIDIDTSTLVDLDKPTEAGQQRANIKYSLELAKHVRSLEPGIVISLGGEIGHIGGKNSTVADFRAYMKGFKAGLPKRMVGMSKISVQTGTSHGGVVRADGTLAQVDVDFEVLASISKVAREEYQLGGAVQHGASTLPDEFFNQFAVSEAIEVHLATGFQNIIMDHSRFDKKLLKKMYAWLDKEKTDEHKEGQSKEQFHYKLRKKAWGEFKRDCWQMETKARTAIRQSLMTRFEFLFKQLNVVNSQSLVAKIVKAPVMHKKLVDFGAGNKGVKEVKGLSD